LYLHPTPIYNCKENLEQVFCKILIEVHSKLIYLPIKKNARTQSLLHGGWNLVKKMLLSRTRSHDPIPHLHLSPLMKYDKKYFRLKFLKTFPSVVHINETKCNLKRAIIHFLNIEVQNFKRNFPTSASLCVTILCINEFFEHMPTILNFFQF
jgi:hypothetical protein